MRKDVLYECVKTYVVKRKEDPYAFFTPSLRTRKFNFSCCGDHRSKFSNLSNWKEEAWKNQGFKGVWTRDLRDTGVMLYQLSYEATHWERGQFIEFTSSFQLLKLENLLRWSLFTSSTTALQIWIISYILPHHFTAREIWTQ